MTPSTDAAGTAGRSSGSAVAKLRYRFDNAMARGPMVVIAYLAALSLVVIVLGAVVATAADFTFGGAAEESFFEDVWQSMLRMVDAGTFAGDGAWPTRLLGLLITLLGIFLAGSLIGLIANAVDQKVGELRRGHNAVVESGHTLILGWSPQVPRIIGELVVANESERSASVVVLATADKTQMEETLRERVEDPKSTRIVCRSGNPAVPADLSRAAIEAARSIIIVRDSDGDAGVVKTVLAVRALDPTFERAHVVAELEDAETAQTIRDVTEGRVLTVASDDVVAEVTAQACLRSGLAAVFTDLLDFEGDEIYFTTVPELTGHTYRDALIAFEASSVIGRLSPDGVVELNPPADAPLAGDDSLILIAEDDSAITFSGLGDTTPPAAPAVEPSILRPVRIAMVGWSSFGAKVLRELDEFLPMGSTVEVVVDADLTDPTAIRGSDLKHASVAVRSGADGQQELRRLAEGAVPDQIIVLGYRDSLSPDDADARTLLTLLNLRRVFPNHASRHVRIVAELLDQRNLVLADPVGVDDLIVSDALASLLMAQLSEHAELQAVFDDLFDAEGVTVDLVPATNLVLPGPTTWREVVLAAAVHDMSAFGYRVEATGTVVLNPQKATAVELSPGDQIIALVHVELRP